MTTSPTFKPAENARRLVAQKSIKAMFEKHGKQCEFVSGLTPKSMAAVTGNKLHFRINKKREVKDPFHPTHLGATVFLKSIRKELCTAIANQL